MSYVLRFYSKETPDVICQAIKACTIQTQPECRLFPNPKVLLYKALLKLFIKN